MPRGQPRFGIQPTDILFDAVEGCDLFQTLFGDGCGARLRDLVQFASRMRPAVRQSNIVIDTFEQAIVACIFAYLGIY